MRQHISLIQEIYYIFAVIIVCCAKIQLFIYFLFVVIDNIEQMLSVELVFNPELCINGNIPVLPNKGQIHLCSSKQIEVQDCGERLWSGDFFQTTFPL